MPKKSTSKAKKALKNDESQPNYKSAPIAIKPESLEVKIREKDIFEQMRGTKGKK
jgi:hypothetical protein